MLIWQISDGGSYRALATIQIRLHLNVTAASRGDSRTRHENGSGVAVIERDGSGHYVEGQDPHLTASSSYSTDCSAISRL